MHWKSIEYARFPKCCEALFEVRTIKIEDAVSVGGYSNLVHVQPAQWERLKQYWGTEKQVLKSAKMVDACSKVKHVSVVGRKGKAGQQALAVSSIFLFFVH
jgi:hypothetical protein